MTPEQLSDLIVASLADLSAEGAITLPGGVPETVTVERPRQKGHGDYATNVALQLAKQAGQPPREFAGLVAARLEAADGIAAVEVAGPGFLNISVEAGAQGQVADDIVAAGAAYGGSEAGQKQKVNLEFVSANPTGPVTLASARWAAVGDTLARLLEATGARRHPRVLLQRPRRPDRPVQPVAARGRAARADTRGRLPGAVHHRDRRAGRRRPSRGARRCPTTRRWRSFRANGVG